MLMGGTLIIGDDFDPPVFHHGNTGVCGSQVYSDNGLVWLDGGVAVRIGAGAGAGEGEDGKGTEEDKEEDEYTIPSSWRGS